MALKKTKNPLISIWLRLRFFYHEYYHFTDIVVNKLNIKTHEGVQVRFK